MDMPRVDADRPALRIGDAERDECVDRLIEHHVQGRLGVEEFERRRQATLMADTAAELAQLVADLPGEAPSVRRSSRPSVAEDFWELEPKDRTIRLAVWLAPPAALVTGAALAASYVVPYSDESQFAVALATGILGYATRWAVSRHGR